MCTDCELRYKCWTTRLRPRILNGVAWQFSTVVKRSCKACLHSKFRESPCESNFVKVGVCTKYNILVHNNSTCKSFKMFNMGKTSNMNYIRFRRSTVDNKDRIKNTYRENMSRNELAIYIKRFNNRTRLPMVCLVGNEGV